MFITHLRNHPVWPVRDRESWRCNEWWPSAQSPTTRAPEETGTLADNLGPVPFWLCYTVLNSVVLIRNSSYVSVMHVSFSSLKTRYGPRLHTSPFSSWFSLFPWFWKQQAPESLSIIIRVFYSALLFFPAERGSTGGGVTIMEMGGGNIWFASVVLKFPPVSPISKVRLFGSV